MPKTDSAFSCDGGLVSWDEARDIMGNNAFSVEEVEDRLKVLVSADDRKRLSVVPFSRCVLKNSSALLFPGVSLVLSDIASLGPAWRKVIFSYTEKQDMWYHREPFFTHEKLFTRWYLIETSLRDIDDVFPGTEVPRAVEVATMAIIFRLVTRNEIKGKWPFNFRDTIYCRDVDPEGNNIIVGPFYSNGMHFGRDRRLYERRQAERRTSKGFTPQDQVERRVNLERRAGERRRHDLFTVFSYLPTP